MVLFTEDFLKNKKALELVYLILITSVPIMRFNIYKKKIHLFKKRAGLSKRLPNKHHPNFSLT